MKKKLESQEKPLIPELDWNFDNVPQDELVACCHWEYARESARIRAAYDPEDRVVFRPPSPHFASLPDGTKRKTGTLINSAKARFIKKMWEYALPVKLTHDRASATAVVTPFAHPWLQLPRTVRSAVITELAPYYSEKPGLTFLPFNRCSDLRDLGLADEDYRCAEFDEEQGIERLRAQIDWGGFKDAQIVAAFKAWVADNRPHAVGIVDERGQRKQKGYRDYLAWLGIMRLMSTCPFTSIEGEMPKAWSHYRSADWPRARKKAIRVFKSLFPFLPPEDLPIHSPTAGGRAK